MILTRAVDQWPAGTQGFIATDQPYSRWVDVDLPWAVIPGSYRQVRVEPGALRRMDGGGRHLRVVS